MLTKSFYLVENEPWDYDADFWITLMKGMLTGFKDGDANMKRMSGAFQADTPDVPGKTAKILFLITIQSKWRWNILQR